MDTGEDWGHDISRHVLRYYQNGLRDSTFFLQQNELLYYHQPFLHPTSVECLGLDCKVEYTNGNQGIMPEAYAIWVQYTESEENDLDNTFEEGISSFPVLYFTWTPQNQILQFQVRLPAWNVLSAISKRGKQTQHQI
jgi:hypothetical protein